LIEAMILLAMIKLVVATLPVSFADTSTPISKGGPT
jgi:hypothetical protein